MTLGNIHRFDALPRERKVVDIATLKANKRGLNERTERCWGMEFRQESHLRLGAFVSQGAATI